MKSTSATESQIQREGVRAILLKAGLDPEKARRVKEGYTKDGERYWIWAQANEEDR